MRAINRITAIVLILLIMFPQITYAIDIKTGDGEPQISTVTMFSDNADTTRAYQGDTVTILFQLIEEDEEEEIPADAFEVLFDGQKASIFTWGYGTYYCDVVIDEINPTIDLGKLEINHIKEDGSKVLLADRTTDGTYVFLSDKTSLIQVPLENIVFSTEFGKDINPEEEKSLYNLFDNNVNTYAEIGAGTNGQYNSIYLEFKDKRVSLSRIEFLSRQDEYYTRSDGIFVQGSVDGVKWVKIAGNSGASKRWQYLNTNSKTAYKYYRISSGKPWYGNISELRLYTQSPDETIVDIPKVTDVSLSSSGKSNKRALPGDEITLRFKTDINIKCYNCVFSILMIGMYPEIRKIDDNTYEASITVPENSITSELMFNLDYLSQDGRFTMLADETSDNSSIFVTNEDNMINLLSGDIDFIDFRGTNNSNTFEEICNLIDDDENTSANFSSDVNGRDSYITFDFKNNGISLSRIEVLPGQNDNYKDIEDIDVLASNDGVSWKSILIEKPKDTKSWQSIYTNFDNEYRYIRIDKKANLNFAELKLFKSKDITSGYSRYINLGTKGLYNPQMMKKAISGWQGSKVYFGSKDNNSILWRVLNKDDDGSVLLFADDIIESNITYNYRFKNETWETCTVRAYLNGYIYQDDEKPSYTIDHTNNNFIQKYYSDFEARAIKESSIITKENAAGSSGGNDTLDKLFLLSLEEVVNPEYGFINNASRAKADGTTTEQWWWIRTVGTKSKAYAAVVDRSGEINAEGVNVGYGYNDGKGIRPAFRVDSNSVLLTTLADINKNKYSDFGSIDSKVESEAYITDNWKFTLKATSDSLDVKTQQDTDFLQGSKMKLDITHKPASILDEGAQVSAALVDEEGNILYYGRINDNSEALTSSVELPAGLKTGKYTLKVFAEKINDGSCTDYGTEFSNIDISIKGGIAVEDILGLPQQSQKGGSIILDGHVKPERASFNHISYYIKEAGETGAAVKDNILTYENPGTVTMIAIVKNGLLYGKPFIKEFSITIEDHDSSDKENDSSNEDNVEVFPPEEDGPSEDKTDDDSPEVRPDEEDKSEVILPEENSPIEDQPEDVYIPDEGGAVTDNIVIDKIPEDKIEQAVPDIKNQITADESAKGNTVYNSDEKGELEPQQSIVKEDEDKQPEKYTIEIQNYTVDKNKMLIIISICLIVSVVLFGLYIISVKLINNDR